MYDELVKRLRSEAVYLPEKFSKNAELLDVLMKAANAIEELLPFKKQVEKGMGLLDKADELLNAVKPRWIPVTERLPDGRHDVLAYAGVLFTYITIGYYDGLWKFSFDDSEIAGGVDYWMPLPEPPKEET